MSDPESFNFDGPPSIEDRLEQIRRELDPQTPLEQVLVEDVQWGVGRCQACRLDERSHDRDDSDPDWWRSYDRGQKVLHKNLAALLRFRDHRDRAAKRSEPQTKAKAVQPKVVLTASGLPSREAPLDTPIPVERRPEEIAEAIANWRDEIAYVPSFQNKWAVHLPTGKVCEYMLSLKDDGVDDARILRNEPKLRPRDLAAMRACEAAGLLGPFYPCDPTPSGIRRLDAMPPRTR